MKMIRCDVYPCKETEMVQQSGFSSWTAVLVRYPGSQPNEGTERHVCPKCLDSFNRVWYGVPYDTAVKEAMEKAAPDGGKGDDKGEATKGRDKVREGTPHPGPLPGGEGESGSAGLQRPVRLD